MSHSSRDASRLTGTDIQVVRPAGWHYARSLPGREQILVLVLPLGAAVAHDVTLRLHAHDYSRLSDSPKSRIGPLLAAEGRVCADGFDCRRLQLSRCLRNPVRHAICCRC